ncbi:MAG: hypothetical protein KY462_02850 [Actinobacteria bacterium]|nr:hypothetical protein [Actinomycetota bacterium]
MAVTAALVSAVVVLAAAVFALWWLGPGAEHRAEMAAATAEAREDLAVSYDGIATAVAATADTAADLRLTLQQYLTESQRSDEEITTDRLNQQAALDDLGRRLQEHADAPPPDLPDRARRRALAAELERLAAFRSSAGDLGERAVTLATRAEQWAAALLNLRAERDRYIAFVEGHPDTQNPAELRQQWESERPVLADYRSAAEAAIDVDGLDTLADAYLTYVEHNIAFGEEAIALLTLGDLDEYNTRVREVFGAEDPFGFQAAAGTALRQSLDAGVIGELGDLSVEAENLRSDAQQAARQVASASASPG